MELVLVLAVPLAVAALIGWQVTRRDRRRWDATSSGGGDGGRAYRQAQAEAGHARDSMTKNVP